MEKEPQAQVGEFELISLHRSPVTVEAEIQGKKPLGVKMLEGNILSNIVHEKLNTNTLRLGLGPNRQAKLERKILQIGIIGGSGLDDPDILEHRKELFVDTIYGKPSDALIEGKIDGIDCVLLARHGRKHAISPTNVNYRANIWALKEAGCTVVVASIACGSLKEEVRPGDLVVIDQFIDRTTKREQTFFDGITHGAPSGICHLPMEFPYHPAVRRVLIDTAKELGIKTHENGTCVCIEGPRFSSLAESKLYRSWDASLVNMTTVPEVVLAKEAGLLYAAVAMATDYDCWRDDGDKVSTDSVLKTFRENSSKVTKLFRAVVPKIASQNWAEHVDELQSSLACSTF